MLRMHAEVDNEEVVLFAYVHVLCVPASASCTRRYGMQPHIHVHRYGMQPCVQVYPHMDFHGNQNGGKPWAFLLLSIFVILSCLTSQHISLGIGSKLNNIMSLLLWRNSSLY